MKKNEICVSIKPFFMSLRFNAIETISADQGGPVVTPNLKITGIFNESVFTLNELKSKNKNRNKSKVCINNTKCECILFEI